MEIQYNADGSPFVMWGDQRIELETSPIEEKFYLEKAATELRETPEVVTKALAELRELIKGDTRLSVPIDRDDFLLKFLRPCKFYADSAFKRIQNYYKFRKSHPEYCHDLMPSSVRKVFEHSVICIMSPRDQHGRRILFIESGDRWNHREVPLKEVFRGVQVAAESAIYEERTQICGVVVVFNMKGLSLAQVMQFTPSFAKMAVDWIQDCAPIRVKDIFIINQPYIFNMVFQLFKPFLREKLRSRIHFLGSKQEALLSRIDAKCLRERHGGSLPEPEVAGEVFFKMLSHYEDRFFLMDMDTKTTSIDSKGSLAPWLKPDKVTK